MEPGVRGVPQGPVRPNPDGYIWARMRHPHPFKSARFREAMEKRRRRRTGAETVPIEKVMFSDGVSRFPGTMTGEEQGSGSSQSESKAGTQEGKTEDEKAREPSDETRLQRDLEQEQSRNSPNGSTESRSGSKRS